MADAADGTPLKNQMCETGTASSMWPMPLAAHLGLRDLDAAAVADHAAVADALVLAAGALPVLDRAEDPLAEQAVLLRLERPVVDRLRLRHLAVRPLRIMSGEASLIRIELKLKRRRGSRSADRGDSASLPVTPSGVQFDVLNSGVILACGRSSGSCPARFRRPHTYSNTTSRQRLWSSLTRR